MSDPTGGYAYAWAFDVSAQGRAEFERHYGPQGTWVTLFRRAEGYVDTLLLRDLETAGRYLTIDRWQSEAAYRSFRVAFADEYAQLDLACEGFTRSEQSLGNFDWW